MPKTNLDELYKNGAYLQNNPSWHVEHSGYKAQQVTKLLERNRIHPKKIVEVGCGAGEILNILHGQLPDDVQFFGYEISPQAFHLCQTRAKPRLSYLCRDFLGEPDASCDLVLCLDVVEHIPDYLGFLQRLAPKGTYKIFRIPLDLSWVTLWKCALTDRYTAGHIHYFTKEIALAALKDTGYTVIDCFFDREKKSRLLRRMIARFDEDLAARLFGSCSLMVLAR
jgi:SAM-dependent methyltransferase